MQQLMNTLYLTTPGTYVKRDGETVEIHIDGEKRLEIPMLHLNGIVCYGNVLISPGIILRFAAENRSIVWHDSAGRFKARLVGPTSGNVLLRQAQMKACDALRAKFQIARNIVAGKIRNAREIIQRGARGDPRPEKQELFRTVAKRLAHALDRISPARSGASPDMEFLRGIEGNAARDYFSVYGELIRTDRHFFQFDKRTRRPPRDPVNALLSFLYTILLNDCVSALEGVGLDPQFGYLHEIRSGRPSLALDLMEELRPIFADRLVLTLINRKQITPKDFEEHPGGSVLLSDRARKAVIMTYQERKQTRRFHPILNQKVPFGLIPHIQARLLARHLRGDLEQYIPFYFR
jgi:CRISPR-associated protein Cas1